ncbi:Short-chain dehydrogenase reductase SDR protein [Rutstroemia sp. NJR-2017a BBW]|nr:Short-chain dehydrogenase reductase SDR protein [Rutstroemia sp. NJR-2017a BBW]
MKGVHLLAGKTAAITGGTTGIGRAIALLYIRQGCNVAINHLALSSDSEHLESLLSEASTIKKEDPEAGTLIEVAGDVSNPETGKKLVERAVQEWGRLDVFVEYGENSKERKVEKDGREKLTQRLRRLDHNLFSNTVPPLPYSPNSKLPNEPNILLPTRRTNLDGAFYSCQSAARQMALQQSPPGGSIIAISSISALVGGAQQTHYTPTKAGVLSLTQSMACALGKYHIRCNALLPGTIRTQLNEEDLANDEKRKYMEGRIPLGRTGIPSDLAGPAVFLASEELSGNMEW